MTIDSPIPHPAEYRAWFRLFNERAFYEAHEVLEDLWVMELGELRDYYKGLIMAAVAILHWQRGNRSGALGLYRKARVYLAPYPPRFEGFALGEFRDRLATLFAPLEADPLAAAPPSEEALPRVELLD